MRIIPGVMAFFLFCQFSAMEIFAEEGGAFNPYRHATLPITRPLKGEDVKILQALGGEPQSLVSDAAYRPHWKEEAYPVILGNRNAAREVIVVLDFALPASRSVWKAVNETAKANTNNGAVVFFAQNTELYGTDLTGLVIWTAMNRPGQAADCLTWILDRWQELKLLQKKQGRVKIFQREYDATASAQDYPMVFTGMNRLRPAVPESMQNEVADYAYEAGNVNFYQASEICRYYGVKSLPAVIVDGKVLSDMSASGIASALRNR